MIYRSSNAFYLRLGRGDGEFGAAFEVPVDWQDDTGGGYGAARLASATPVAAPNTAGEISTGDLDGDGKIDWLVPTSQGFRVVPNKGLCDYRPQTEVNTGIFATSSAAALVDADQDGDLDVLIWVRGFTPTEQNIKLYLNSGTGSFTESATIRVGFSIESVVVTGATSV